MVDAEIFVAEKVEWIKREVGARKALAAISGGVDSVTTALLGWKALGERLEAIFLDDGLMREGDAGFAVKVLNSYGVKVKVYNVAERFFEALRGKSDPEEKRKAFREVFYQTLADIARSLKTECLLQGTIAADVVETVRMVKTQHNVLEQIGINPMEHYGFKVVEPLKELYKHEVREVAKTLGLPAEVYERKPFPGPGLAIRVLGEVTPKRIRIVRKATRIVEEETRDVPCFQAFAILLGDKATGLTPQTERNYGAVVAVRIVDSRDAMAASFVRAPYEILERISKRIISEIPEAVRVVYDITDKPPATIEWE